jgi:hypothetical protein
VATDGCFGYLASPMDFEYLLLQTLFESQYDFEDWQYQLTEAILKTTGDDASMSLWAWGFENLNDLKNYFFDRQQVIYQTYIQPLAQADKPTNDLRQALWQEYKKNYYIDINSESC